MNNANTNYAQGKSQLLTVGIIGMFVAPVFAFFLPQYILRAAAHLVDPILPSYYLWFIYLWGAFSFLAYILAILNSQKLERSNMLFVISGWLIVEPIISAIVLWLVLLPAGMGTAFTVPFLILPCALILPVLYRAGAEKNRQGYILWKIHRDVLDTKANKTLGQHWDCSACGKENPVAMSHCFGCGTSRKKYI